MITDAAQLVAAYGALAAASSKDRPVCVAPTERKAILFSPHPDDECIMGALPLRLQREAGLQISVVPVTLGSKPERRAARRKELEAACQLLNFAILEPAAQPFDDVRAETRQDQPILWHGMAAKLTALLERERPEMIFVPHRYDGHPTHIGTHSLVMDALAKTAADFSTRVVFTEFWHPQAEPNLLVDVHPQDLTVLIEALMCHGGEIARNPYHRSLPAWMIDNARRGAELIGGFGAAASLAFAVLYHAGHWRQGRYRAVARDVVLSAERSAADVLT